MSTTVPPLIESILTRLTTDPGREALREEGGTTSRGELHGLSGLLAHALLHQGLRSGQRLLVALPPSSGCAAAVLAGLRLGTPVIPLSPKVRDRELRHVLFDSAPRLAIAEPPLGPRLRALSPAMRVFAPEELLDQAAGSRREGSQLGLSLEYTGATAGTRDPALVLYTSGTSGLPKGVVHTQGSLAANLEALARVWGWCAEDRLLLALPFYHLHGLVIGLLGGLLAGMGIRLVPRFDADRVLALLETDGSTLFYGVPTHYSRLAACSRRPDLARLRFFASGSAALPPALQRRVQEAFGRPVLQRYGATEFGIALAQDPDSGPREGLVGTPLPGVEVRIAGTADDEETEEGELLVRGPSLFAEYLDDEEATRASHDDGFFRTGDLVRREQDGRFRILGRLATDVFKCRGHKIGALEIEAVLDEHPEVAECAVIGVPDPEDGEVPVAFVRPHQPHADATGILEAAARELAPYQVPRRLVFLDDLPRTGPGKVDKQALLSDPRSRSAGS